MRRIISAIQVIFRDSLYLYWELLKIMVPVMILVKFAVDLGLIALISPGFGPVMSFVGLPAEMGLVWLTTMLVNPYAGAVVLLGLLPENPMTTAQLTVLGTMMLMAHSLPVEGRIVQKAGGGILLLNLFRITGALLLGILLSNFYFLFDLLQGPANTLFFSTGEASAGWSSWLRDALETLLKLFIIIIGLLALLRLFDFIGVTRKLVSGLRPFLRFIGVSEEATYLVVSGALLGLAFGGALIIKEVKGGKLSSKDVYLSLLFLCLCHGVIEDTLFILTLGGHLSGILAARLIFTVLVIASISRLVHAIPDKVFGHICSLKKDC